MEQSYFKKTVKYSAKYVERNPKTNSEDQSTHKLWNIIIARIPEKQTPKMFAAKSKNSPWRQGTSSCIDSVTVDKKTAANRDFQT